MFGSLSKTMRERERERERERQQERIRRKKKKKNLILMSAVNCCCFCQWRNVAYVLRVIFNYRRRFAVWCFGISFIFRFIVFFLLPRSRAFVSLFRVCACVCVILIAEKTQKEEEDEEERIHSWAICVFAVLT